MMDQPSLSGLDLLTDDVPKRVHPEYYVMGS